MSPEARAALLDALAARGVDPGPDPVALARGDVVVGVAADDLQPFMSDLRNRDAFDFDMLIDLTALDLRTRHAAFDVVYQLYSTVRNHRLSLKVRLDGAAPSVASVVRLWPGADWLEREVFDLFGIEFNGHPGLRRIFLPDGFDGHPLRRDYARAQEEQ